MRSDTWAYFFRTFPLVHQPSAFLSCTGFPSEHSSSVWERRDPVDLRIVYDRRMRGVHQDDLIVMVHSVFANPVGVQDLHVRIMGSGPFLDDSLCVLRGSDLLCSASRGFPATFDLMAVQPTVTHVGSDDDVALFCFISKRSCTIDS